MKLTRTKKIAIILVAIAAIVGVVAGTMVWNDGPKENRPLEIASWSIQSGSYYPRYWVNVSDDLWSGPSGFRDITFAIYDKVSNHRELTSSGGALALTRMNYTGSLNLQDFVSGTFVVHVYINLTIPQPSEVHKTFHDIQEITTPSEHPEPPLITGLSVAYNATKDVWHYTVQMVDPDGDNDTLDVYLIAKDGFTKYHARAYNSLNATDWNFEADINVTLAHELYTLSAEIVDKDGPYSERSTATVYP